MSEAITGGKGLNTENAKAISIIVVVVAVLVAFYFVFKSVFNTFGGIKDSIKNGADSLFQAIGAEDTPDVVNAKNAINKAQSESTNSATSYWTPMYFNNAPSGASFLTVDSTNDICKDINDSYSWFSWFDTPQNALSAIKKLPTKTAVSFACIQWDALYNSDLLAWLTQVSRTDEDKIILSQIIAYCDSLPAY